MLALSITSTSSAQADGQSCGQVECRISTLACWFIGQWLTPKTGVAERIYPAMPLRKQQPAMQPAITGHSAHRRTTWRPGSLRAGCSLKAEERHDHRHAAAIRSIILRAELGGEKTLLHPRLLPFTQRDQENAEHRGPCCNRN